MNVSPVFLIALLLSALLGGAGGSALRWAGPEQGWNLFTAAFLWTLIAAAGTTIGRFAAERVRRGDWRRGLWLVLAQSFPLTTTFMLVGIVLSTGLVLVPSLIPILYGATLVVALVLFALGVFTSPYR